MAHSEPPSSRPSEPIDVFFLGLDSHGNWVAQDQRHKRCGLFVTEAAALRFIRSEKGQRPPEVIRVPWPLEFDLSG
jgi:hypothetical protein